MRVLVACEESQVVCKAFRARGHEAYSCDILPCSGGHPEWHIQDDVLKHLDEGWDLMIAHPPCTFLCNSGVSWLYNKDGMLNTKRWENVKAARNFFKALYNANIPKIVIENPIPHAYAMLPKYAQIVQPYMFGHPETKATCLWLKNLPNLVPTNDVYKEMTMLPKNKQQRLHYLPPSEDRAKIRARTFEGIAHAMSERWG